MKLRPATTSDLDALVDRWYDLATAMETHDDLNELAYPDRDAVPDDGFRAHLDDDDTTDYLLVHAGETIGFLTLREGTHPSRSHDQYLRVVNLAIDEPHRNRGHGATVLDRVRELARERGCDFLKVGCEWDNEGARRFYTDAGFRPKRVEYVQSVG
ncbi:GNAT family N-acetyltransferase [Halobaculum marinum]|uniref:GNAT family N-acetyltransferase n=1 Tax=Halobaculum marinum TaxID=3031996 RepID=A0ABD5X1G4_9EURY|nr:GNAT family N-acetyltransferase [Halobaculum sp. DT55]